MGNCSMILGGFMLAAIGVPWWVLMLIGVTAGISLMLDD